MCGITGFVSKKFDRQHLQSMSDCLSHRGPDADGFFYDEATGVGLAHRRLSIIDLSAAANQPFYSADGRYVMIYNGEVYNFQEIAARYNIQPRTHSDTEIILEAFAKVGVEAFRDLNGMFALVIYDRQTSALYLLRDRVGIKPLYYWWQDEQLAFGSELKSILRLPLKREINQSSVCNFLHLGYIPGDDTIYKNFYKLLPGQYAVLKNGKLELSFYWQLEMEIKPEVIKNEAAAKKTLTGLLQTSVNYCMISDVPLGIFLSGGVDSSLVAAIAQSVSGQPVKTFSIGFEEKKYNESKFATQVANHIRSSHYEFQITEQDALEQVDRLTGIYDEPYADSSAIPTMIVSKMAREHVTVALSGDGGDELFMGYGFYTWARRMKNPLLRMVRKPMARALQTFGNSRLKRGGLLINYDDRRHIKGHIFSQEQYFFSRREIAGLVAMDCTITLNEEIESPNRKLSAIEEQSFFDIKNYLPEELLVKTDRASMYHSLEVRVPLLDHRLVEFAINLDDSLKMRGNIGKYLLKEILYDYVPKSIFDRPKWGFAVPLAVWMQNELHYLLDKYLSKETVESTGLVRYEMVALLRKKFEAGEEFLYHRLWALIILHKWYCEQHREKNTLHLV